MTATPTPPRAARAEGPAPRGEPGALPEALLWAVTLLAFAFGYGLPSFHDPGGFTPGPKDQGVIRVVTWNVGGTDGDGGRPLSAPLVDHVADVLAGLDPDVVVLQELADRDQADRMLRELGWREGDAEVTFGGGRRVAVLTREGRLRQTSAPGHRGTTLVCRRTGRGVVDLTIGAVHASAWSSEDRNAHVGEIAARLEQEPGRVILAGDLNLDLDLDKRGDLFSDDAYRDVETYNYVAARFTDAARGRGSTAEPDRRLDYVFVRGALTVIAAGPVKDRRVADMDHDPVVADLRP